MCRNELFLKYQTLIDECITYQLAKSPDTYKYKEDLRQDLYVWFLTYDEAKLHNAIDNNHLNALITRIIQNWIYSASSPFYKKYVQFRQKTQQYDNED